MSATSMFRALTPLGWLAAGLAVLALGGVLLGDVVTSLDGQAVEDTEDLLSLLIGERVGRGVPVEVLRGGGRATLEVTVGERG